MKGEVESDRKCWCCGFTKKNMESDFGLILICFLFVAAKEECFSFFFLEIKKQLILEAKV